MQFRTLIAIFIFVSLFHFSNGSSKWEDFKLNEYPTRDNKIWQKQITHGDLSIELVGIKKNRAPKSKYSFTYRAWINVTRNSKSIFKRYFSDIDTAGSSAGLSVPTIQPSDSYVAIVKKGDYDGRLFLIQKDGIVFDLMGGHYFISKDHRYLFSEYDSDISGLAIFDIKLGKVIFSSAKLPYIFQWYCKNGIYFFTECEWLNANNGLPSEIKKHAYFFDVKTQIIKKRPLNDSDFNQSKKVLYDSEKSPTPLEVTTPNSKSNSTPT